jgi:hypothetical protein
MIWRRECKRIAPPSVRSTGVAPPGCWLASSWGGARPTGGGSNEGVMAERLPSAITCCLLQRPCQHGHQLFSLGSREREVDQITSRVQRYQHDRAIDGHSRSNNVVDDKGLGVCPSRLPQNYTFPTEQLSCRSFDAELLGGGGITSEIEPRPHCITIRSSARGSMAGPSEPLSDANIARASVRTILGNCSPRKANVALFRQIAEHLLECCYKRSLSLCCIFSICSSHGS